MNGLRCAMHKMSRLIYGFSNTNVLGSESQAGRRPKTVYGDVRIRQNNHLFTHCLFKFMPPFLCPLQSEAAHDNETEIVISSRELQCNDE